MSLYHKYRPTMFKDVVGQDTAVQMLERKLPGTMDLPHVILFSGPTGTGKTTLARILAAAVGCYHPTDPSKTHDYEEPNAADNRGIDDVRAIAHNMGRLPMKGRARVYVLDEVVQWPKPTQQAFLKAMEDTPPHIYFFLCASDVTNFLPTFEGRCFHVKLNALSKQDLGIIIDRVLEGEGKTIEASVFNAICINSNGNARKALLTLEACLAVEGEDERLTLAEALSLDDSKQVEFLARAIMRKDTWAGIAAIIDKIDAKEVEGIRQQVLAYATRVMLGKSDPATKSIAYLTIQAFRDSWLSCGKAGLCAACWEISHKN